MRTAPLWKFAEVNPSTPEFDELPDGDEITFLPLETIWPGGRADYSRTLPWSSKLSYTTFRRGDVLVPKITPTFEAGRSIVAAPPTSLGIATTEVHVIRPREGVDARFLCFAFQSIPFLKAGESALQGVGNLRRVSPMFMQTHRVLDVPLPAQRAIADYLDRETGEIDAMFAKLDALAGVLEARRSTEIQSSLLDANAVSVRLKFCADVSLGKTVQGSQKSDDELLVNYVRAANIQTYGLALDEQCMWMSEDEIRQYDLKKGDVLIVEGGAGYGRSVVLEADMPGWGFQNHIIRVRAFTGWEGRFLNYGVKMHFDSGLIDILVDGATIPALSSEKARQIEVPLVDLPEQRRIADHLDEVTGRIDAMLAKVAQLKALLLERRAALITNVVTGRKEVG